MGYQSFEQLRAWAARREDWPALCDALEHHGMGDEAVHDLLPVLQTEPELAELLLRGLPDWRAASVRAWLRRRLLPPDLRTVEQFFALATERARRRDPTFPAADGSRLLMTFHWFAGEHRASDQREHGVGWVLDAEDRDVGPAEVIHEDEWTAVAHGQGWGLRIYRLATGSLATKCYEEDL